MNLEAELSRNNCSTTSNLISTFCAQIYDLLITLPTKNVNEDDYCYLLMNFRYDGFDCSILHKHKLGEWECLVNIGIWNLSSTVGICVHTAVICFPVTSFLTVTFSLLRIVTRKFAISHAKLSKTDTGTMGFCWNTSRTFSKLE